MQLGTEFFWYRFEVTKRTCSIFLLVYGNGFRRQYLACVSLALVLGRHSCDKIHPLLTNSAELKRFILATMLAATRCQIQLCHQLVRTDKRQRWNNVTRDCIITWLINIHRSSTKLNELETKEQKSSTNSKSFTSKVKKSNSTLSVVCTGRWSIPQEVTGKHLGLFLLNTTHHKRHWP